MHRIYGIQNTLNIFVIIPEFVTFDNDIYQTTLRDLSTRQLVHDDNSTSCLDLSGQLGMFRTRVYMQTPTGQFEVTVIKTPELPCYAMKVMETQSETDDEGPTRFSCNPTSGEDTACKFTCRNRFIPSVDIVSPCQELIIDVFMQMTSPGAKICSIIMM